MTQKKSTSKRKSGRKGGTSQVENRSEFDWFSFILYASSVLLLCLSVLSIFSIVSYFFDWRSDYSIVMGNIADSHSLRHYQIENWCGIWGARVAQILVGSSFGVAGLLIPIFLIYITTGFLFKLYRIRWSEMTLTTLVLLFISSATLGALFGTRWGLFNSGAGGAFGLEITILALNNVGKVGYWILLLFGWFVTAILINRNFVSWVAEKAKSLAELSKEMIEGLSRMSSSKNLLPQSTSSYIEEEDEKSWDEKWADNVSMRVTEPRQVIVQQQVVEEQEPEGLYEDDDFEPFDIEEEQNQQEPSSHQGGVSLAEFADGDGSSESDSGVEITVETNELQVVSDEEAEQELYDPMRDLYSYVAPPTTLLHDYQSKGEVTEEEIIENKTKIEATLNHFGIAIQRIKATVGPTITLYEIVQEVGVKISKIKGLEDDIAQSLKATGIRIIAPIPGLGTIGIEVPNKNMQVVSMYSSILSQKFQEFKGELPVVVGRTIQNECYVFDLAKMPHLLVAGATGQGKSVGLNAIITSLLYRKHPSQLKLVMIDPKRVEFTPYRKLENHFLAKMESEEDIIVTEPKKAVCTLNALCDEMEKRLQLLSEAEVRNIVEYNEKFVNRRLNPEKGHYYMPYIVTIIDEFADLIMMDKGVEVPVMRLAQKARAIGIHLIVATQRPDVKVITGGIKANFPARIAFRVMQMVDSRTIIDQAGANQLIGRGDMLFLKDGLLTRVQCALVETDEVSAIVKHISDQQGYTQPYLLPDFIPEGGSFDDDMGSSSGAAIKFDSMFIEAARHLVENNRGASASGLQRDFGIGYPKAGKIMMQLEKTGIVARRGSGSSSKPQDLLITDLDSLEEKLHDLGLV